MNTKLIGNKTETLVCNWLKNQGFSVLERNFHCVCGEIDIICIFEKTLSFIEVKKFPVNWEISDIEYKIDFTKQHRIKKTASVFLSQQKFIKYDKIEFDVIAVIGNTINFYKGAF